MELKNRAVVALTVQVIRGIQAQASQGRSGDSGSVGLDESGCSVVGGSEGDDSGRFVSGGTIDSGGSGSEGEGGFGGCGITGSEVSGCSG